MGKREKNVHVLTFGLSMAVITSGANGRSQHHTPGPSFDSAAPHPLAPCSWQPLPLPRFMACLAAHGIAWVAFKKKVCLGPALRDSVLTGWGVTGHWDV